MGHLKKKKKLDNILFAIIDNTSPYLNTIISNSQNIESKSTPSFLSQKKQFLNFFLYLKTHKKHLINFNKLISNLNIVFNH